jgi:glycosyltransferase involved in cell wall biosynthesis
LSTIINQASRSQGVVMDLIASLGWCQGILSRSAIVKAGTEILESDTLEGLADLIQQLLTDDVRYQQISAAARQFVLTHYQWEDQVNKIEHFIREKNAYSSA